MDDKSDQTSTEPRTINNPATSDKLQSVKQRAMQALVPLIGELKDVDPQIKFDICLNAIRYTDDKELAEVALDAALAIKEKGNQAEAIVQLINEINYLQQA